MYDDSNSIYNSPYEPPSFDFGSPSPSTYIPETRSETLAALNKMDTFSLEMPSLHSDIVPMNNNPVSPGHIPNNIPTGEHLVNPPSDSIGIVASRISCINNCQTFHNTFDTCGLLTIDDEVINCYHRVNPGARLCINQCL